MDQFQLDSLDKLVHSRSGSFQDIKDIQTLLKAEGRYTGIIDGDFGSKSAMGICHSQCRVRMRQKYF